MSEVVEWHLDCFQFGTIVKNAALIILMCIFGEYIYTHSSLAGVELLDYRVCVSVDTVNRFQNVSVYTPTRSVR